MNPFRNNKNNKSFIVLFTILVLICFSLLGSIVWLGVMNKQEFLFGVRVRTSESDIINQLAKVEYDNSYGKLLLDNARAQIGVVTSYDTKYWNDGFPPENTGACADAISKACHDGDIDFKGAMDEHIRANEAMYLSDGGLTDENINFRRVRNIRIFLEENATSLTREVVPDDFNSLKEWQGGDIVTYAQAPGSLWHIAFISDKRDSHGVPKIIHNFGWGTKERGLVTSWSTAVTGHFRIEKDF